MSHRKPGSWKQQAVNAAEFDAWDRAMRKRLGRFAGLRFFQRTNTGGWNVISQHWPHKLCWDWFINWSPYRGAHWDGPRMVKFWGPSYGSMGAWLWFGRLALHWQDDGWMGACGPRGADAPKIIWKHQIDEAPFNARTRALSR
jgi:hypothetical protein